MKLKTCTCGKPQTTKNAEFKGRVDGILWFNCTACHSTFTIGGWAKLQQIKNNRKKGVA